MTKSTETTGERKNPVCKDCGQTMFEIGGIGKDVQIGEYRSQENGGISMWHQTGIREQKLYQCPEDKTITIK